MVPRIHKKGKSFRGAAMYVLHDKDKAKTDERVAWTQTRNIGVDDPHTAWKIMAATSMDQDRLKSEAGVPNTGRKSKDHVLHLTLSWHEQEAGGLTQDEMMRAVNQAIHQLDASDRQALIAAHKDTAEPHVHILINRVSPDDGRLLSSSNEKLKLSAWAEHYEKERGEVLCEARVINNDRRQNQQYTRDDSHRPYHIHEVEISNDNKPGFGQAKRQQIAKDAALAADGNGREQRRREAWESMEARHAATLESMENDEQRSIWASENETAASYRPHYEDLHRRHAEQMEAFESNEDRFLGRVKNAFRSVNWREVMRAEDRPEKLKEAYGAFSSSGARLEAIRRAQEAEREALRRQEIAVQQERADAIRRQTELVRKDQLALFEAERQSAILTQKLEDAAARSEWQKRNEDRRAAYERLQERERTGADPDDRLSPSQQAWIEEYKRGRSSNDNERNREPDRDH